MPKTSIERASASKPVLFFSSRSVSHISFAPRFQKMSSLSAVLSILSIPQRSVPSLFFHSPFSFLVSLSLAAMIVSTGVSIRSAAFCHRCSVSTSMPYLVASVIRVSAHSPASAKVSRIALAKLNTFLIAPSIVPVTPLMPSEIVWKLTFLPIVCSVAW